MSKATRKSTATPASKETPKKDPCDYYLAGRLNEIARHLHDMSLMLYEDQDQAGKAGLGNLVTGSNLLLDHYADKLEQYAGILDPEKGGEE